MKLDRKGILSALETITIAGEGKNMVESGAVKNVLIFGNEVTVDLLIATPAMHIKKRAEDDIKKLIHEKFSPDAVVKVNIKVETPTQNPNEISEAKQVTQKGNYTESKEEVLNIIKDHEYWFDTNILVIKKNGSKRGQLKSITDFNNEDVPYRQFKPERHRSRNCFAISTSSFAPTT